MEQKLAIELINKIATSANLNVVYIDEALPKEFVDELSEACRAIADKHMPKVDG